MNAAPDTPPARTAPLALWRIAHDFLLTLHMLFGNPEDLACSHTLARDAYKLAQTWLRVAEALLRRLLLIEAVAFAGDVTPASCGQTAPKTALGKEFDPSKPETWRVSLRCFAAPPASSPASAARIRRRPPPIDNSADLSSFFSAREEQSSPAGGRSGSPRRGETLGAAGASIPFGASPSIGFAATSPASGGGFHTQRRFFSAVPLAFRYEALLRAFNDPTPFARRLARRLRTFGHRVRELLRAPDDAHHKIGDDDYAALTSATEPAITAFDST